MKFPCFAGANYLRLLCEWLVFVGLVEAATIGFDPFEDGNITTLVELLPGVESPFTVKPPVMRRLVSELADDGAETCLSPVRFISFF